MGRLITAPKNMDYCIVEHQHKARPLINALAERNYRARRRLDKAKFLLIDHEWRGLFAGKEFHECRYRKQVLEASRKKIPVFIYPHSVRPNIPHDLADDYYPGTTALFTIAEGHKEILSRIGYPHPVEVIGWYYTEICPFRQKDSNGKIRVLFAPIHPVGNGYLPDDEKELNAKTYTLLLGLMDKISLTVRHIQSLENNNLWEVSGVEYIKGSFTGSTKDMDNADVVIGAFTYAHMAVALGHPLVMVGEGIRPHNTPRAGGKLIYARNWEKYREYMKYPYNIENCKTSAGLLKMINKAMLGGPDVEDWKQRFIGEPFIPKQFVKTLESYVTQN